MPSPNRIRQTEKFKRGLKRAKANGIAEGTYASRVTELGWDIDRAATERPKQIRQRGYLDELCKTHGITRVQYKRAYSMLLANELSTEPEDVAQLAQHRARTDLRHWFKKIEDEEGRDFTDILRDEAEYCDKFGLGLNDAARKWGVPWPSVEFQARKRGVVFPKRHMSNTLEWKGRKDELTKQAVELTMTHSALDLARIVVSLREQLKENEK